MEMHPSSWAESRLLLAQRYGDSTQNNILWSHTETNSLLYDLCDCLESDMIYHASVLKLHEKYIEKKCF